MKTFAWDPSHDKGIRALLTRVYAEYGQVLELDTLDADLLRVADIYAPPSAFRVLAAPAVSDSLGDGPDRGALGDVVLGTVACKVTADVNGRVRAELKRVFLDRSLRGQGEGYRLSLWAAEHARSAGAQTLDIWSDILFEDAHRLYMRMGAQDTGERRHLGGRNAVDERHFALKL